VEKTEVAVIGAGAVGLAVAWELSRGPRPRRVLLIERHPRYGQEVSARSSEVIHAGLYHPPQALKSRLCVRGNRLLYAFCAEYGVPHRRCGKLVVATEPEERPALERLYERARANGCLVEWLGAEEVGQLEPEVRACAAIRSPASGILDSAHFLGTLYLLARVQGVQAALATEITAIERDRGGYRLWAGDDCIGAEVVVNAAGLASDRVAAMAGLDVDALGYRLRYSRGEYFQLRRPVGVSHLLYPLPGPGHLGVHLTLDLAGGQRLGPDARDVEELDYAMDERRRPLFLAAARRYLPALQEEDLAPAYVGIRPRLAAAADGFADFIIAEESARGLPGFVNCIGIESPGLTACLAIGQAVVGLL
jgi:L-2-hydroxyglutarate oxidase LhgO